jgi:hypothetical protein
MTFVPAGLVPVYSLSHQPAKNWLDNVSVPDSVEQRKVPAIRNYEFAAPGWGCLVEEKKIFKVLHPMCRKDVGRNFRILIKNQITEPVRKLRDESNDTN